MLRQGRNNLLELDILDAQCKNGSANIANFRRNLFSRLAGWANNGTITSFYVLLAFQTAT